ncbi:hypothetical protein [Mycolicibacterium nivoides]|uniref:Uncharacterized protein n=1 Tax=Mycolicibacterium nivoides TaxID=2487344 RepID=A0ABW9LLU1_9MYCO
MSRRLGLQPRPETTALAAKTEAELVEHRSASAPAKTRLSPVMQLVEADQRSREAQRRADEADQGRLDAQAAAAIARADADESAHVAQKARERVRAIQADSAEKDRQRARERAADQQAVQLARVQTEQVRADAAAEIEQVRADATTEVAAAQERAQAAEERATQRTNERTAERREAERKLQELQTQLDSARADSATEVAAARERAQAAEERAEQRLAERAAERAAGEEALARLRREVEKIRADTAAEIAAVRARAQAEVDRARSYADDMLRQARELAAATTTPAVGLTIPIAPMQVRAQVSPIETVVDALYRIDFLLEAGMAHNQPPVDINYLRGLTRTVQEHARGLSTELANLPMRFTDQADANAAASYADAAGAAYTVLLQRIEQATQRMRSRDADQADEIGRAISTMVTDQWVQALRQPLD